MSTIAIIVILIIILYQVTKIRSTQKKHVKLSDHSGIMMDEDVAEKERKFDEGIDKFANLLKRGTRKVMG